MRDRDVLIGLLFYGLRFLLPIMIAVGIYCGMPMWSVLVGTYLAGAYEGLRFGR